MAVSEVNNNFNWHQIDLTQIQSPEDAENDCINDARMERLKSAGLMILSGTAALGDKVFMPLAVALVAFEIASLVAGIVLFPLAIIFPLYDLVSSLAGIGLGLAAFGAYIGYRDAAVPNIKNYANEFFKSAQDHWNCSNHWYSQADRVRNHFGL